ncbi:hypothetical protein SDRG_07209 [Saprolegnia diclina VS20]|uniref:Uncharacterized protein n=2 Tax=Saprolegnia TaxID=4769 RepID=A0A067CDB4_SAPPC|nr:hypothetical protein SDRG_07209 [Saprolegnia diclina VS20]XP_012204535.1 hypothetical protein SPRG_20833 [Saprolegnia parasitica CBS 223.65]EQC35501.1 hypothetical protein SDRG_07209 [Saprolegnia diclina VS20]KDO24802.1 hypothetical protein SPRG_20833 [Saprolegnia parasitica CBS 223.65]|eukprot:XP_008611251.1 hypothetical protein SDRG_07209 [Saprolegnia diclina VS20]
MNRLSVALLKRSNRAYSSLTLTTQWEPLRAKLADPRARASLDSLKQAHAAIMAEAREFAGEPEKINFAHYKALIKNKDLVEALEENYASIVFPDIKPVDCYTAGSSLEADLKPTYERLDAEIVDSVERIEELKELIALMEETRTTKATTIDEVAAMHPEIVDEIDEEIANYDWEKDVPQ